MYSIRTRVANAREVARIKEFDDAVQRSSLRGWYYQLLGRLAKRSVGVPPNHSPSGDEIVEVVEIRSTEVIEVLEAEDEGCKYCYRIGPSECLLIRESDVVDDVELPTETVQLTRSARLGAILSIATDGNKITPMRVLQPEFDGYGQPSGTIFSCSWGELLAGRLKV